MPNLTIRTERPMDYATVARVVEAAFDSPAVARLVEAIRVSEFAVPDLTLVAERDGNVIGHVMISMAERRNGDERQPIAMLSPLAVHPDEQGRGVGSALVRTVCARAAARGEPVVVVEGDPAYYSWFGFEPAADHGLVLPLPSWAPPEAGQVLRLADSPPPPGQVVYPPAFDGLGER